MPSVPVVVAAAQHGDLPVYFNGLGTVTAYNTVTVRSRVDGAIVPDLPYDELFPRLEGYVGFTPINNTTGSPAMSLPLAQTSRGLPLGVHFAADYGDERTLLELAFELEEARPFARIQES